MRVGEYFEAVAARNRRHDYGFTIGGPVWIPHVYNGHDKTFIFINREQYREAVLAYRRAFSLGSFHHLL